MKKSRKARSSGQSAVVAPQKADSAAASAPRFFTVGGKEYKIWPLSQVHPEYYCKKVCPTRIMLHKCPFCDQELNGRYTYAVGINDDSCVKSNGVRCVPCDTFFTTDCELFAKLESIKIARSNYTLIRDYACDYDTEKYRSFLDSVPSACRQYTICRPGEYRTYTIVTEKADCDPQNKIFHYSEEISRKVMTAYMLGKDRWELDGQEFFFAEARMRNGSSRNFLPFMSPATPVLIQTGKNGGLFDNRKDKILLDALAFIPSQGILVCVGPVTYDRNREIYYIDNSRLRKIADEYGLMLCNYVKPPSDDLESLREESFLHQFGYNVGQEDNLTSSQRQTILSQVMEAEIMKPTEIIALLNALIRLSKKRIAFALARMKWEEDLDFVNHYGVKTKGFAIGLFRDL